MLPTYFQKILYRTLLIDETNYYCSSTNGNNITVNLFLVYLFHDCTDLNRLKEHHPTKHIETVESR